MGLTPVAAGDVATVVTTLEMPVAAARRPLPPPLPPSPFRLRRWTSTDPDRYRALFRRVGERWLWYSRLALDDAALAAILTDPGAEILVAQDRSGVEIGMVELAWRNAATCELVYFALVPALTGQRHGDWLMAETLARAWRPGVERLTVNTCTLDHPGALGFYRRHGFVAVRRTLETFADPRALGLLPADAAPQTPYLAATRR